MTPKEQIKVMTEAMKMCEADLRREYDDETIAVAKAGIGAMIQTVLINGAFQRVDIGKVMCVVITMLRTLDIASDIASDITHKEN